MALQDVLNILKFTTRVDETTTINGNPQKADIIALTTSIYSTSLGQKILDEAVAQSNIKGGYPELEIRYVAKTTTKDLAYRVNFDTNSNDLNNTMLINSEGEMVKFTNKFLLAHELAHAIKNADDQDKSQPVKRY